jgi:excisionase family DNA binding protein
MSNDKQDMILARLERLEQLTLLAAKTVLNTDDVCDLTGLSKPRIYALCNKREIPHYKQGSLYFKRDEVEKWMTARRVPTAKEINSKAAMYCHTHQ